MSPKINSLIFGILLAVSIIPLVNADNGNVTSNTTLFITMDPIGNHSINDVLLIHGTTNLPVSNDSIHFSTFSTSFNPGGFGSSFSSNISIQSGENGVNFWSVNATADRWILQFGRSQVPGNVSPGEFAASVWFNQDSNVSAGQLFFLLPPKNIIPNQTIVTIPPQSSPMIQPTTSAAPLTTTQSSPLPIGLPIAILTALAIMRFQYRRKR